MNSALAELAIAHGVDLDYYDIWGRQHHASEQTLKAILAAMGVDANSDEAIAAALHARALDQVREIIPPATIVRDGEHSWHVRLTLADDHIDGPFAWQLTQECGATHTEPFAPVELPEIERVVLDGRTYITRRLAVAPGLPKGYHRLSLHVADRLLAAGAFIVVPKRSYWPRMLSDHGRVFGVAAQLYAVRSARNFGIGDFSDLTALIEDFGARGAAIIGLNPLHALFPHNPAHASPYSPSSRLFRNWLYIDVAACEDFSECSRAQALVASAPFQAQLNELRAAALVDYVGVARVKREVLELLYAYFRDAHLAHATKRADAFRAFQSNGGRPLRKHALFEALQEQFCRDAPQIWGWPAWPTDYHDPDGPAVARFATEQVERVEFFEYLQWQADEQYARAAHRSFELGLGVGVYEDLAISVDRGGAEIWSSQDIFARGAGAGAPPDDFNLQGQDWGLPPMIPARLRAAAYEPFIAILRANMKKSGALRIDHVMGLMRLFWVPPDGKAIDGVYVRYPFADLLGLVCLESERNRCLVIGEDLGTVPDEVRHALWEAGVLSYRLLYFERRHDGEFKAPHEFPEQAIVAASTHDLPTLAGWWAGRDIELRERLALFPNDDVRNAHIFGRQSDRPRLLNALARDQHLPDGVSTDPNALPAMTAPVARAIQTHLAATPAKVMIVQLDDALLSLEQMNLPGTIDEYENWRNRLSHTLEAIRTDADIRALFESVRRERP